MSTGPARVVWDTAGNRKSAPPVQVLDSIVEFADGLGDELIISTPFFVPDDEDVEWYRSVTERGVRVRILTNSLASNIGTISNSGYRKYRRKLLAAGVELYELRTDADFRSVLEIPPTSAEHLGLHAKAIVLDRKKVYVGSLNLDRRSIYLNTEMGILTEDPVLADRVAGFIERIRPLRRRTSR